MIGVEVCINCDGRQSINNSVGAAYSGGALRVELCRAMHVDGLTPRVEQIKCARRAFRERTGLLVMIRPRPGDFNYSRREIDRMIQQIHLAAESGADGIVLGVLRGKDNCIDGDLLFKLKEISDRYNFSVTFHRAFDATPDPLGSTELLIQLGINRVLTSGTPWGKNKTAMDGTNTLNQILEISGGRIEIVIGGGLNIFNVSKLIRRLSFSGNRISIHSYSGVQEDGTTKLEAVKSLVEEANRINSYLKEKI